MNYSIVRYILGRILMVCGCLMLIPIAFCIAYDETYLNYLGFLIPSIIMIILGAISNKKKPSNNKILAREGFVIVGLSWFIITLFGCLPFVISREIPNFIDAFFESVSGFTTTGASILNDVTALSHSMLFWRSFTNWLGGMGVLVFVLAFIPESKEGQSMHILRAESPGPQVGKLVSKMQVTSRILYLIYIVITLILFVILWVGPDKKMDFFNSLTYSLSTAGTGGFGVDPNSLESYTNFSQYVISIFMILFGVNFSLFYLILIGNIKDIMKNEELRLYFIILTVSVLLIFVNLLDVYDTAEEAFRKSLFQVTSILSTSGFTTANYDEWPVTAQSVIFVLMFFGSCAGSTAGGMKITRINIILKSVLLKMKNALQPRKVETITIDKKPVDEKTVDSVQNYFITYFLLLIVCAFIVSFDNNDFLTNISASLSCLSNIGPGFHNVGPYFNYNAFSGVSKIILSIEMIAGRLELFPVLMLFRFKTWSTKI